MIMDKETWNEELSEIMELREQYLHLFPKSPYPLAPEEPFSVRYFVGNSEETPEVYFTKEECISLMEKAIRKGKPLEVITEEDGDVFLAVP